MTPLSLSHPILSPLDRCLTLGEVLLKSGEGPHGVTYINSSAEHERVGYAELGHRALATLGYLQTCGVVSGDTVVLVTEDLALFTAVFWACALGGIVVAPIATPANEDGHAKLANVIDALRGAWLASDHPERVSARLREGTVAPGHFLALGRTMFEAAPGRLHAGAGLDDVVLLQFSSGSTGHPKGVQITGRNLLANTSGFVQRCQLESGRDLMLNWMPLTHDFGIVFCHVLPVLFGIEQALIPTMVFMRHPLMWMQKASELGATVSAGPNYAYQHFLKRFRPDQDHGWDLSRLRLVINGAEPISCELSRSFFEALHRYGLSPLAATPGYGLAEATLMVTLNPPEVPFESIVLDRYRLAPGTRLARLERGHPDAIECANVGPASDNVELRITDADRQPVADEVIGTIETRGACVTLGYHGMPELNQATISAQGWLDTGDLGFISGGHLYITGRRKDLVIINGANYYPHDIENIAAQVPPLDLNMVLACAVPLPEQNREGLAIFVRTRAEGEAFFALADRVRDHVLQCMGVPVDHCLPVQQIPKTTSGKLRRFLLSEQFQAGVFDADVNAAREHMARGQLRCAWDSGEPVAFRTALLAEAARLAPWCDWTAHETAQAPLMDLGFGSLRIVEFLNRINLALQQQWPVSMMFDHASVDRLAEHLLAQRHAPPAQAQAPAAPLPVVHATGGDIAIIGLGCRFPGDASTPEAFWTLLVDGTDATGPFPSDRWNPALNAAATTDRGAYLQGLDRFDHRFFRLTPVEAERLDPQQRLLLTVSWEAFESAGLDPVRLHGSDTGVFTGISGSDYAQAEARSGRLSDIGPYAFSGSATSIASGRLSFFYGFEGPNVALDTACSSALSAVHWAVRALRASECDLALASAVNLILSPEMQVGLSRMNALSPDGRCRTFDAAANGYARGEGCASVVLKRLEDALRDGDPIRAVIKGSAMNHDGASNGLTAPNGRAQEKVLRAALRDAGLAPGDIDYVEAHGTGTALGDPVEVMALAAAYGSGHGVEHPLWIGSVKTNVAHLEAAAGMASLCKVVAALQHGTLPPTLHLRQPNPMIPWDRVPVKTREILGPLLEEFRPLGTPSFQGVKRSDMPEIALGNAAVVDLDVFGQGRGQLGGAGEAGLRHHLGNTGIEALHQAVGLRMAWRAQPVLDGQGSAAHVEVMPTAGRARLALEAVGEARAVVGEHLVDAHGGGLVQPLQEVHCADGLHVGVDPHEHPARGAVDGHIQVAPGSLVGHLRQVLDVHMHEAGLIVLERLGRGLRLVECGRQLAQAVHPVAAQAAVQRRARQIPADELARDHQQIVQRQQQQPAQLDHDGLLCRAERCGELVRAVAEVAHAGARLPLRHRRLGDVVAPRQLGDRVAGGLDLGAHAWRRAGLGVNLCHGVGRTEGRLISLMMALARSNGQLRVGQ